MPQFSRRKLLGHLAVLALPGCTLPPRPDTDVSATARYKRMQSVVATQEPVDGPISLYEAMARALKYNLDARIEEMDTELQLRQLELKSFDQLPSVVSSLSYLKRNNDSGSRSRSLLTDRESLEPSTSSERQSGRADIVLSWDLLDYGLSRIRGLQQANQVMVAKERRRKVTNRIMEDVRTAYWRAVSADRTFKKLADLESLTQRALLESEEIERRRIAPPMAVLAYQRDLLQTQAEVQRLQRELVLSKNQLAALMNLPPQTDYQLVLPDRSDVPPDLPGAAVDMVLTGLRYRPELREAAYARHSVELERRASMLRALPSIKGLLGLNYDSNDFLYNRQWVDFSARVTWNLLYAFRYPAEQSALTAELAVADQRELALTLAIMTQVHVARTRFVRLAQELGTIRRSSEVQQRIATLSRGSYQARSTSQQNLVKEEMNTVLAEIRYDTAFSDLQNAYANLYASMGLDNFQVDIDSDVSIDTLTKLLQEHWTDQANTLPKLPERESVL